MLLNNGRESQRIEYKKKKVAVGSGVGGVGFVKGTCYVGIVKGLRVCNIELEIMTRPLDVWKKKTRDERGLGGKSLILEHIWHYACLRKQCYTCKAIKKLC